MATIENNVIHDLEYGEYFNVLLANDENPAIHVTCDFEGMPTKTIAKLAFDILKIKLRSHIRGMSVEELKKAFDKKTISWRDMLTKEGAKIKIELSQRTPEELDKEIERLMKMRQAS